MRHLSYHRPRPAPIPPEGPVASRHWSPKQPLRPTRSTRPGAYATKVSLASLGRPVQALDEEIASSTSCSTDLVTATAPELLALFGVGSTPPPPCSWPPATTPSGCARRPPGPTCAAWRPSRRPRARVTRHRLDRGGDRQANRPCGASSWSASPTIPDTAAYIERRTKEGRSKREVIRILKRYVAREVYRHLPRG